MKLEENDDYLTGLTMDYNEFITGQSTLTPAQMYNITQSYKRTGDPDMIPMSFTYAYAITCWKAQGSEYAAVVIGSLSACALLHLPDEALTQALLLGKPVYLCPEGLEYRQFSRTANRALWSRLLAAERQLKQLGVRFLERKPGEKLLTANDVRRLLREGLPVEGRLTPLARDVLEGRA